MKVFALALCVLLSSFVAAAPSPVTDVEARAVEAARPMKRGADWAPAPQIKRRVPGTPIARSKPSPSVSPSSPSRVMILRR